MIKIAPSILSADFTRLGSEVKRVEEGGADLIHVDVMDGHFVPNISIGQPVVRSLRKVTKLPLDVHLMIGSPKKYVKDFVEAGSDIVTVHAEATNDLVALVREIADYSVKVGVSIKPRTSTTALDEVLDKVDLVLIMSVEPGFSGQEFMPEVLPKIEELARRFQGDIAVDGGINLRTAPLVVRAGANVLVAGSAIFGSNDPARAVRELKRIANDEFKKT